MKVKEKKLDDGNYLLEAVATPDEVNSALQNAQIAFAQSMGLKYEEGKTIEQAAKDQMGITDIDSIIAPQAIELLVPFALDKRNLIPAYLPKPKPKGSIKPNQEFEFEVEVAPKPTYELSSYDPIKIEAPAFKFDDSLVDMQLEQMASNYISYEKDAEDDPDRTIEPEDTVKLAIEAYEDGEVQRGLTTDGRVYVVGKGFMPEGFDRALIGMKAGETKKFSFDGPGFDDDMNEVTKTIDATVTVLEFQHEVIPAINDEWVKKNMPLAGGIEKLKEGIRADLETAAKTQYDSYLRQMVASEAAKRFEGHIEDEVYESARDGLVANIRADLQQQGKTWEKFVEENGGEQTFGMMMMLQVREMLTQGFALDAVFRHEKLKLEDEDIDAACAAMNPQAPPAQLRHQMESTGKGFALRETAERLKANNWLLENADITFVEDEPQTKD